MFSNAFKVIIYLMVVSLPHSFAKHQDAIPEEEVPRLTARQHAAVYVVHDNKNDPEGLGEASLGQRNLRLGGRRDRGQNRGGGRGNGGGGGNKNGSGAGAGGGAGGFSSSTSETGGGGGGNGFGRSEEMGIIQNLIANRADINRTVQDLGAGEFQTETTSERPEVAGWIQEHVQQMLELVYSGRKIRKWDPLFDVMFDRISELDTEVRTVDDGVIANLQGVTPCGGVSLVEAQAYLVSKFISIGRQELHAAHEVPEECA
jgi:hypothetical protein